MQRLEVSCAIRRIYTSLGAKGLIIISSLFTNRPGNIFVLNAMSLLKFFPSPTLPTDLTSYDATSKLLLVPNVSHFKPKKRR